MFTVQAFMRTRLVCGWMLTMERCSAPSHPFCREGIRMRLLPAPGDRARTERNMLVRTELMMSRFLVPSIACG